jgi:hypothetical protein
MGAGNVAPAPVRDVCALNGRAAERMDSAAIASYPLAVLIELGNLIFLSFFDISNFAG